MEEKLFQMSMAGVDADKIAEIRHDFEHPIDEPMKDDIRIIEALGGTIEKVK